MRIVWNVTVLFGALGGREFRASIPPWLSNGSPDHPPLVCVYSDAY